MTSADYNFDLHLPARIARAEYQDPVLLLGGDDWSMSAMCCWRWVDRRGRVVSPGVRGVEDDVWDLIGADIIEVTWQGPSGLIVDPIFDLGESGTLELFSDAAFDTWIFRVPEVTLVGPLGETA